MRTGHAIIGANYGDEGKGLMTDYLASRDPDDCLVVRFNGGAQAGHTVVAPDRRRHIFSHFGAGTFVGCPTHLSQFFIVNPLFLLREHKELRDIGLHPVLSMDSRAFVTTPYDIFINQLIESRRGASRHGTCGIGINETVTRCLRSTFYRTTARHLLDYLTFLEILLNLGKTWFPQRLAEHRLDSKSREVKAFKDKELQIMMQFVHDAQGVLDVATITSEYPSARRVIFEGAQGLMLDEYRIEHWPHLTRSRTGLANVVYLLPKFQIDALEVTYVTRTYLTRHGAGSLAGERDWSFRDDTNVTNRFQGNLRFAPLDCRTLLQSIDLDLSSARRSYHQIKAGLAITCADQLSVPNIAHADLPVSYTSYGPCRNDVQEHALTPLLIASSKPSPLTAS